MKVNLIEKYVLVYVPWLLALVFKSDPEASYVVAWLGSFFILFVTISGKITPLPSDLSFAEQLMRPIILVQIIFAGYMACTSIFYFLDVLGYENFKKVSNYYLVDTAQLELTAQCQRYYCLGHAALVTGMLICMKYPIRHQYRVNNERVANLLLIMAIITLPLSYIFQHVQGLSQFSNQFNALSFIAGTLALAFAIPQRKITNTIICAFLYISNFYQSLLSGYKEPIITSIMVLGIFLYPHYKKIVLTIFVPALVLLFLFLPTYNRIFRENAWADDVAADQASEIALDAALSQANGQGDQSNWYFLVNRLSEIDMFTKYVKTTPNQVNFYGFTLLEQAAYAIIPRVFWPSKPNTEDLVMERVYNAGVIHRGSIVSAKPAFIVDAYLSAGAIGIFISLFLYGAFAQLISQQAEKLFGGYILGTAFIFSGLFQIFWRGLNFEFIINTVFWSYVSMLLIQKILVAMHVLEKT